MRHRLRIKKLGRHSAHRAATLRALGAGLLIYKKIKTSLVKAKALRSFIEPIMTCAKENTLHKRSLVWARLLNKEAIKVLFNDIAPRIKDRQGGYTRIIKAGYRKGDGSPIAYIELVDYNTLASLPPSSSQVETAKRKKTRRSKTKSSNSNKVKSI